MAMSKLHKISNRCDRMRRSSHRTDADYRQYRMSRRGLRDARLLENRLVEIPQLSTRKLFKIDAKASASENRPETRPQEINASESNVGAAIAKPGRKMSFEEAHEHTLKTHAKVFEALAAVDGGDSESPEDRKKRLKRERDARYRANKKNKSGDSVA